MKEHIGEAFQYETKYRREAMRGAPEFSKMPAPFKEYPEKTVVSLPEPGRVKPCSLKQAVQTRRRLRPYASKPVSIAQLSFMLWAAGGSRGRESGLLRRTVPSAGGLYPIETYVVVNAMDGLEPGVYHYVVRDHSLERLEAGRFREALAQSALDQNQCREAPVVFVWSAVFGRTVWKDGQRSYRYVYLDAGHVAHALAISATSLGLATCQMAALFDDEVNALLGLDGKQESVVYMSSVGHPT